MLYIKILFVLLNISTCFAAHQTFRTHVTVGERTNITHSSYMVRNQAEEEFVRDVTHLHETALRVPQSKEYYKEHRTLCYKIMQTSNSVTSRYIERVGQWVIDLCLPLPLTTPPLW